MSGWVSRYHLQSVDAGLSAKRTWKARRKGREGGEIANLSPDRSSSFGFLLFAGPDGHVMFFWALLAPLLPDQFSEALLGLFQRLVR